MTHKPKAHFTLPPTVPDDADEETIKLLTKRAKARLAIARATAAEHDAAVAENLAITSELAALAEVRKSEWVSMGDGHRQWRIFHLMSEIDDDSVSQIMDTLSRWHRLDVRDETTDKPIVIRISSPGGEMLAGFSLYTFLKAMGEKRRIITIASGLTASMATIIHQAGTERWIEPTCSYLIHDASASTGGKIGDMTDDVKWITQMNEACHAILAERSTLTPAQVKKNTSRKEWWLLGPEVVKFGFADRFGSMFDLEEVYGS